MRYACTLVLLAAGCLGSVEQRPPGPDAGPAPDAAPMPMPTPAPRGLLAAPRHGSVLAGSTRQPLQVAGYLGEPGARVDIQTLSSAGDLGSWSTVAVATSEATPAEPGLYRFALEVVPQGWRPGGVFRLRALDARGVPLATFDASADSDACMQMHASWRARLACAVALPAVVLVSPAPTPAETAAPPRFLDLCGSAAESETDAYYQAIGAPATLAELRARYRLDDPANVVSAYYYNAGDLGIGRAMHCAGGPDGELVCAVANFGSFGGAAADALAGVDAAAAAGSDAAAFATVVMLYRPPASVDFMVYGAGGALARSAALDTHGDNTSIPHNCLNCHGAGSYDAATHRVSGGRFLPFDPTAFRFVDRPGLREADQAEALRRLNSLVARTGAPAGSAAGSAAGWSEPGAARVYRNAVQPFCMGCHASQRAPLDFASAEGFRAIGPQVARALCDTHTMPNAEVSLARMWASPARAYLVGWLGAAGDCAP